MGEDLISMEEYEAILCQGRSYDGYVWNKEGEIIKVKTDYIPMRKPCADYPNDRSLGIQHTTSFFDTVKTMHITLADLGSKDILYDENGDFISLIDATDDIKGEIKILRGATKKEARSLTFAKVGGQTVVVGVETGVKKPTKKVTPYEFEPPQLPIPAISGKYKVDNLGDVNLRIEVYSKIFTHIISLMKEVDLKTIKEEKISIQLEKKGMDKRQFYNLNLLPGDYAASDDTNAYMNYDFNTEKNKNAKYIITAVLYDRNVLYYQTIWNIMNLLGAHEYMGHAIRGYCDNNRTHYMAYLYQMGHSSWKHTTKDYQKEIMSSYSGYIGDNMLWGPPGSTYEKELDERRKRGIFPKKSESKEDFIKKASKTIQERKYYENNMRDQSWDKWRNRHETK